MTVLGGGARNKCGQQDGGVQQGGGDEGDGEADGKLSYIWQTPQSVTCPASMDMENQRSPFIERIFFVATIGVLSRGCTRCCHSDKESISKIYVMIK